jgi:hypothetical protein
MTDTAYLDNYSPFDDDDDIMGKLPELKSDSKPAKSSSDPSNEALLINGEEITAEMLDQMEQRLNMMEHDIEHEESRGISASLGILEPDPNWPKCYPLVHFDINEVDSAYRPYVNEAFFNWIVMCVSFGINFIATLCLLSVGDAVKSQGTKIAFAAIYFFLLMPLALNLNALSVYKAMKTAPETLAYTKIFIALSLTFIFEVVLAVGLENSGSVGLITTINLFSEGCTGTGILGIIVTICMSVSAFFTFKLLVKLWRFFRGTEEGGNMQQNLKVTVAQFVVDTLN